MKLFNKDLLYFSLRIFSLLKLPPKGFTLIELIIVMAILGILAAGLLAAINPVEQVNRATDTTNVNATKSISDAINRTFATTQAPPWTATTDTLATVVTTLITRNELKSGFTAPASLVRTWASTITVTGSFICTPLTSSGIKYRGNATANTGTGYGCTYPATNTCTFFCGSL